MNAFSPQHKRRFVGAIVRPAALITVVTTAVPAMYLGLLSVAAKGQQRRGAGAHGDTEAETLFAVLVPAHDEANVIDDTVAALVSQRYPRDRFTVNVVADNCTDSTAKRARALGARVFERNQPDDPGKGAALNWLAERVGLESVDAVIIVDADTVADGEMLRAFDREFVAGAEVVQGDYGVRDPDSSPAVALRFAALACRHRLRPLGRVRLGGSCGLYGNGMAIAASVMEQRSWSGHLVEDAEFQLDLLLDGILVAYSPDARVSAEMPATWDGAVSQHQRWELGRSQMIRRFGLPLLSAGLTGRGRNGTRIRRRVPIDALVDLAVPPLSVLVAGQLAGVGLAGAACAVAPGRRSPAILVAALLSTGATVGHVVTALRMVDAPRSVWRALAEAPRLVIWKLGLLLGIVRRPADVAWTRTERNAGAELVAEPRTSPTLTPALAGAGEGVR